MIIFCKEFNNPHDVRDHLVAEGQQRVYRYDNGYGASVVRFKMPTSILDARSWITKLSKYIEDPLGNIKYGSYTNNEREWELAVVKFTHPTENHWELDYTTPITDDVVGHLKKRQVEKILRQIKEL